MAGEPQAGTRTRVILAIGLAVLLATGVAGISLLSGDSGDASAASPAPEDCLSTWNKNDTALELGRHSRTFHLYETAQVGYLRSSGPEPEISGGSPGACVVVFGRADLDPEIEGAGFSEVRGAWVPLSEGFAPNVLDKLQSEAVAAANTLLTADGGLAAN